MGLLQVKLFKKNAKAIPNTQMAEKNSSCNLQVLQSRNHLRDTCSYKVTEKLP